MIREDIWSAKVGTLGNDGSGSWGVLFDFASGWTPGAVCLVLRIGLGLQTYLSSRDASNVICKVMMVYSTKILQTKLSILTLLYALDV